ncbi:beta-lactamase-like protein, partial [Blyttiomyces helicus]
GTSGTVPNIYCLTKDEPTCKTCLAAIKTTPIDASALTAPNGTVLALPRSNPNRRRNTSALLRTMHSDGRMRNILIDCGKTFSESALTWFVEYRLRRIDALLLTHGHADAVLGLDDLRQWTIGGAAKSVQDSIPVYLSKECMSVVESVFPYLVDTKKATGGGDVPALDFHVFGDGPEGYKPFNIEELEVIPIEVDHGKVSSGAPFKCLGYRFNNLTYLSDVSSIPPTASDLIQGTTTLIIDALHREPHASHLSIYQSASEAARLLPQDGRAIMVGMSHDTEHEELNCILAEDEGLKAKGVRAQAGFDGMRVDVRGCR